MALPLFFYIQTEKEILIDRKPWHKKLRCMKISVKSPHTSGLESSTVASTIHHVKHNSLNKCKINFSSINKNDQQ